MIRGRRRDPAPSRLAYRVQRLLLTPALRRAVVWGAPLASLAVVAGVWLGDPEQREILSGAVVDLRRQIEDRPEFQIRALAVDGASPELAGAIRETLRLRLPVSTFDLDLPGLRETVAEFDPVASARVAVRPGGILQVDVEERTPAVVQRRPEGLRLLDAGGHPVRPIPSRSDRADLPLIAGEGAAAHVPEALELSRAAAPLAERLRGFVRVGQRRWDVVLDRGQRIMLPELGAVAALDHAIALDRAQDLLSRDVVALDLRNPRRATLRLSEQAADTLYQTRLEAREAKGR